jgi:hypothetical protein
VDSYDELDGLLLALPRSEPPAVTPLDGPPLPRLNKKHRHVDKARATVTEAGFEFFLDPDGGSVYCSECGGPCHKPSWAARFVMFFSGVGGLVIGCLLAVVISILYISWDQSHRAGGLPFWTGVTATFKTIWDLVTGLL